METNPEPTQMLQLAVKDIIPVSIPFHVFRKLYRDVFETYAELPEMVSTLSGMKNTVYEINSKKGLRKEKVGELEITATETSQNTKGHTGFLAVTSSYQT